MSGERSLAITTPDGVVLDALTTAAADPVGHVVLCHPHPDYGGSMHVAIFELLVRMLPPDGLATTRFDFRRPGTADERLGDLRAVVDDVEPRASGPVFLVGWSYGADLALAFASADGRVAGVVGIAPPLQTVEIAELPDRHLLLVPEDDQFNPPEAVRASRPGARMEVVSGCDHFLAGREDRIAGRIVAHLKDAVTGGHR